ncbi:MAG: ATP-binding protein [Planctomycetaceae bacterium]
MRTAFDASTIELVIRVCRRYAMAVAGTALAIWGRQLLQPFVGDECPFSLFYLSVIATAWMAGTGPAVFAIALGTFSAAHFFIAPSSSLYIQDAADLVQLLIFVFVNCVATFLFNRIQRQRSDAEKRSAENERLSQSLREADERKDQFLALLAHELRNPLAPIRSSLALLERKEDSPEVVRRVRDIIQRQARHLVHITDDLLDIARFCRGKVQLQVARMDLRDAIRDAVEMSEDLIRSKSHRFQMLVPNEPAWVDGDHVRLAQLTSNLLNNAAKYTPEGGRIMLQVEVIDHTATIAVSDNGIGIPPTEVSRILEPFMQIDSSRTREYGGLGVGLTIVERLTSLHGGNLSISSRGPGMGSCFTVSLPAAANESTPSAPPPQRAAAPFAGGNEPSDRDAIDVATRPRRILIVEDNVDAAAILGELFESEGYAVTLARDGIEALQEVHRQSADVILLDIGLPGMDGYEIAKRLRRTNVKSRLIALTGWGGDVDHNLSRQAGFDIHLVKPVPFGELLQYVEATTQSAPRGLATGTSPGGDDGYTELTG